jgi:hypothetical protein
VTGDPFGVAELAALRFDAQAVAAGQDDLDIAAPPTVRGPGLHPGREPLRLGPPPYCLLAFRVPQALRAVLSAGRRHSGRMSEVLLADSGRGLIQAGRLSFVRHPVKSFPPLAAHARLIGEEIGEHDAPVPAAFLTADHAGDAGPGNYALREARSLALMA